MVKKIAMILVALFFLFIASGISSVIQSAREQNEEFVVFLWRAILTETVFPRRKIQQMAALMTQDPTQRRSFLNPGK